MPEQPKIKNCPFTKGACKESCALALTNQDGRHDCSLAVLAMSINAQTAMAAQAAQAQQQALSQAILRGAAPGQGPSPIVL